jgi:acetyl-CoA decarbonylase/synthase complex subunit gamma
VGGDPLTQRFVVGVLETPAGPIAKISAQLTRADRWGTIKTRLGVGRMEYLVEPGLYALGEPGPDSPVLVTANYKLTFDRLRSALPGRDAWIMVVDTHGINVWCAAGKRTFSTDEVLSRIESTRLAEIVSHCRIILPQLCAPGVAGWLVTKNSGFRAEFGPIRAEDLPAYLDRGVSADMRRKTFDLAERTVLIPVELVQGAKATLIAAGVLLFLSGWGGQGGNWAQVWTAGARAAAGVILALMCGAVLTPLLLPWLPGRAFSIKGLVAALVPAAALAGSILIKAENQVWAGRLEALAWLVLVPSLSAFWAMNFTGASTFTSLSGVRREMRRAVPVQVAGMILGLGLWLTSRFAF